MRKECPEGAESFEPDTDERYYDASLAKQRNMMKRVAAALQKAGIQAHEVRGAFRPTLEINEPRKRKGEFTQYAISFD